ncbi:MAG: hypothetical protein M9962_11875 [Oligoflexia bacterium]|nr:hypothetical protein [Oligoflexia bacterium]
MTIIVKSSTEEFPLIQDTRFDVKDFSDRWLNARMSAIHSVLDSPQEKGNAEEHLLLQKVPVSQRDQLLKAVFDCSRQLGMGLSRYLSVSLGIQDFADILPLVSSSCFAKQEWRMHNDANVSEKSKCNFIEKTGSFGCDYWREALDGLVMGASDDVRLARHRSAGHGDSNCVDVLFYDKGKGPIKGQHNGEIPSEYSEGLQVLSRQFLEKGITLKWMGYTEGVLLYCMEAGTSPLCGAGGQLMRDVLSIEVKKFFPKLVLRDVAPLAVIGDGK